MKSVIAVPNEIIVLCRRVFCAWVRFDLLRCSALGPCFFAAVCAAHGRVAVFQTVPCAGRDSVALLGLATSVGYAWVLLGLGRGRALSCTFGFRLTLF